MKSPYISEDDKYKDPIKNSIWNYVIGNTSLLNNFLRKNEKYDSITKNLDEAFKIYGQNEIQDFYRTVDWDYMKNIYGLTKENIDDYIGEMFLNKGYMSTSSECISPWSKWWESYELVLHIYGDITYLDINDIFSRNEIDCYEQKELLLPRNTLLKLKSYSIMKNKERTYLLEMEIQ